MTDAPSITFPCTLGSNGDMSAIPIDFDPRAVFGRARAPVVVRINGYNYRSTIFTMRGDTFVPLRRSHREAAGVDEGRRYEVTLTLDTAPRAVAIPGDLAAALDAHGLRGAWDGLSVTDQREQVEPIEGAKRPDTRARRLATTLARLGAG